MVNAMISLHIESERDSATALQSYLSALGVDVWICFNDLSGGEDYRNGIVNAVHSCDFFIALMNEKWAASGECYDEFSLAKRLNLTSHEKGITKQGDSRKPIILPIAFPDLNWSAHSHIELLAASANFIFHNANIITLNDNYTLTSFAQ